MRSLIIIVAILFTFSLSNASIIDLFKSKKNKKEEKKDDQKDTKKVSDNKKQQKTDVKKKDVKKQETKKAKVQDKKGQLKNKVKKAENKIKAKVQKKAEVSKKPSNNKSANKDKAKPSSNLSKKTDNKSIKPNNKTNNKKPDNKVKANNKPDNKKPDNKAKANNKPDNKKPDNKAKANNKPDNKVKTNSKPDNKKPDNKVKPNNKPVKIAPSKPKPTDNKPKSIKPSIPMPIETRKINNDTKYGDSKQGSVSRNIQPSPVPSSSIVPNSGAVVVPGLKPIGNGIVSKNEPTTKKVNNMGVDFLFGGGNFISNDISKQNTDYSLPEPFQYSLNLGLAPYQVIHGPFRIRSLIHWEGQNIGDYTLGQILVGAGPQYVLPMLPMLKSMPFEASIGTRAGIAVGYSIVWNNGTRDMNFLKASISPFIEPFTTIKTKFSKTMGIGTELSYVMPMGGKSYKIESNGHSYEIKNKDLGGVRASVMLSFSPGF